MRILPSFVVLLTALVVSRTTLTPEDIPVYGAVWSVSSDDIRAAIAAARSGDREHRNARIFNVKACSSSEIHVSFTNNGLSEMGFYAQVKRINGRWRYITTWGVVVTS